MPQAVKASHTTLPSVFSTESSRREVFHGLDRPNMGAERIDNEEAIVAAVQKNRYRKLISCHGCGCYAQKIYVSDPV